MKNNIHLFTINMLVVAALTVGFAAPAAAQSRLVSMQTDGVDVNYEYPAQAVTTGAPQNYSQALSWTSFREFMVIVLEIVIGATGLVLLYMIVAGLAAHYKRGRVRMHSHALMHRHR